MIKSPNSFVFTNRELHVYKTLCKICLYVKSVFCTIWTYFCSSLKSWNLDRTIERSKHFTSSLEVYHAAPLAAASTVSTVALSVGFSPCGRCKRGCRWPWRGQRCLRWGWCPLELRSGCPAATKSSSSCSKASSPRTYSQMDWWREPQREGRREGYKTV